MPVSVTLPPWLVTEPSASANTFLRSYGVGASAGAAARAAAHRDEALQAQREQAAQLDAIRQREAQLNADKFGLELRAKQQALEREAKEAADQLEGLQGFSKDLEAGVPVHHAIAQWGPKMFSRHPERMTQALHQVQPPPTPTVVSFPSETGLPPGVQTGQHFQFAPLGPFEGGATKEIAPR